MGVLVALSAKETLYPVPPHSVKGGSIDKMTKRGLYLTSIDPNTGKEGLYDPGTNEAQRPSAHLRVLLQTPSGHLPAGHGLCAGHLPGGPAVPHGFPSRTQRAAAPEPVRRLLRPHDRAAAGLCAQGCVHLHRHLLGTPAGCAHRGGYPLRPLFPYAGPVLFLL